MEAPAACAGGVVRLCKTPQHLEICGGYLYLWVCRYGCMSSLVYQQPCGGGPLAELQSFKWKLLGRHVTRTAMTRSRPSRVFLRLSLDRPPQHLLPYALHVTLYKGHQNPWPCQPLLALEPHPPIPPPSATRLPSSLPPFCFRSSSDTDICSQGECKGVRRAGSSAVRYQHRIYAHISILYSY